MSAIMTLFYLSMYTGAVPKNYNSKTFPNQQALDRLGEREREKKKKSKWCFIIFVNYPPSLSVL